MKSNRTLSGLMLAAGCAAWFAAPNAHAGKEVGNGGQAVVCRDAKGKILSAELLDLFEAENLPEMKLTIVRTAEHATEQLRKAGSRLETSKDSWEDKGDKFYENFFATFSSVLDKYHFLQENLGNTPIDDSYPTIAKKGCQFEQLAAYRPNGRIDIDSEIFQALGQTDRAALLAHETIYKLAREYGRAKDSVMTRKLVGYLFAEGDHTSQIKNLVNQLFRLFFEDAHAVNCSLVKNGEVVERVRFNNIGTQSGESQCLWVKSNWYPDYLKTCVKPRKHVVESRHALAARLDAFDRNGRLAFSEEQNGMEWYVRLRIAADAYMACELETAP